MKYFLRHPFKTLKAYLPKSMLGRSLLILVAPLVLMETISAYVFFDRHWDHVTKALANDIAGDVATIIDLYNAAPDQGNFYKSLAGNHLKLRTDFIPGQTVQTPVPEEWQDSFLDTALKNQVFTPYSFEMTPKLITIDAEVNGGTLKFTTSRKRLYKKTFFLFIMWVCGTTALFLVCRCSFYAQSSETLAKTCDCS
jgi:two-component system osmolarity sensor histidine kinase EnvZ